MKGRHNAKIKGKKRLVRGSSMGDKSIGSQEAEIPVLVI